MLWLTGILLMISTDGVSRILSVTVTCLLYTSFAQSCGGGGTSSDLPRGRTPDEDDSGFAYRCMMQSHKMFRPAAPKRGMGGRRHEGVLKFAIKIRLIVIS